MSYSSTTNLHNTSYKSCTINGYYSVNPTNGESKQELNRNGNNKDNKNHKDNNNRKKGVNFENTATTKNRSNC